MKKLITLPVLFLVFIPAAISNWQQKTSMPSDTRVIPNIFVIGDLAYIGGGFTAGNDYLDDFWEYNTTNDTWSQKANQPASVAGASSFAINNKGYLVNGWVNASNTKKVYEYDPSSNSWVTMNDFPAAGRYGSSVFVLDNKAYVGLGYTPLRADFWQYDPSTDTWMQVADFPAGPRTAAVHFAISGTGYVGCGLNNANTYVGLNDFYTYDPLSNTWTQIGDFPGPGRHSAVSFVVNNKAYITTGNTGNVTGTTYNDLWEFDPQGGTWNQLTSLPATPRQSGGAFSVGNCGFVFGGFHQPTSTFYNELWQYCVSIGIDEKYADVEAILFPQYSSSQLTFKHSLNSADCRLEVISPEGKLVYTSNIKRSETTVDLSPFAQGIYLWQFFLKDDLVKTGKIVL